MQCNAQTSIRQEEKKRAYIVRKFGYVVELSASKFRFSGREKYNELTGFAALPTISWKACTSKHILWILGAFPKGSPSLTILITVAAISFGIHSFVKGIHMNPLCC